MKIGIIGGQGKFGQWLVNFFQNLNYEVLVSDIDTKLTNRQVVEKSEVVIFSVPISKSVEVIEEVAPYSREGTLWMDVTSLKTRPVEAMLKSKASVIGMHPMFKPTISAKGQVIILCPVRAGEWLEWLQPILENSGAKVKIMIPQEHDEMMALIQGGTHIPLIAAGYALKRLGVNLTDSLDIASPIYRMRLEMIGRILGGDPELYAEIAVLNSNTSKIVSNLLVAVQSLLHSLISQDIEEFVRIFKEAAEFFDNFVEQAIKDTDYLIQRMVERDNEKQ